MIHLNAIRPVAVFSLSLVISVALLADGARQRIVRHNNYGLKFLATPNLGGPCLASLIGPPQEEQSCHLQNKNVDGGVAYEPSRRLVFAGSGSNDLLVIDADSGKLFRQVKTPGRVITPIIFSEDGSEVFFGTDKGKVVGLDAYSFAEKFSIQADSQINDDLLLVGSVLVFTSSLATIYAIDLSNYAERWTIKRPLSLLRLKLKSSSNIVLLKETPGWLGQTIVVPHPQGFLSFVALESGQVERRLNLNIGASGNFPDIVAPMVLHEKYLWVSSYDNGVFVVDTLSQQIIRKLPFKKVLRLAMNNGRIFAASDESLLALDLDGNLLWQNQYATLRTKRARLGYPFEDFFRGGKRVFWGSPSRLAFDSQSVVMATSQGALGVFGQKEGFIRSIVGTGLGFSTKVGKMGNNILAVTSSGLIARIQKF